MSDRESEAFDAVERRVLELAERMTATPVEVQRALVDALAADLGEKGVVELVAAIAWENWRARTNHALGIESEGFAEAASCPLPSRRGGPSAATPDAAASAAAARSGA